MKLYSVTNMGQIITLDNIIAIIEIKSSPDIKINIKKEYNINNKEYQIDYILNFELIEEKIIDN
jgi:hypothetical protein